jgi:hypothetical protein
LYVVLGKVVGKVAGPGLCGAIALVAGGFHAAWVACRNVIKRIQTTDFSFLPEQFGFCRL